MRSRYTLHTEEGGKSKVQNAVCFLLKKKQVWFLGGCLQPLTSGDSLMPLKNKPDCTVRSTKQKGHCSLSAFTHSANQWEEESSSCAGTDVSDWQDKTCGHALLVCFVRERQVSLGHADRKVPKTLRGTERKEKNVPLCHAFICPV